MKSTPNPIDFDQLDGNGKYSIYTWDYSNFINEVIYFPKWSKEANKEVNGELDLDSYFIKPKRTGVKIIEPFFSNYTSREFKKNLVNTGFVRSETTYFKKIETVKSHIEKIESYKNILSQLELEFGNEIQVEQFNKITLLRDNYLSQLNRQSEYLDIIDARVIEIAKVYIWEAYKIAKNLDNELSITLKEEINSFIQGINIFLENIRIFNLSEDKLQSRFMDDFLTNGCYLGLRKLFKEREPVLNLGIRLADTIYILESLLEDYLVFNKIKFLPKNEKETIQRMDILNKAKNSYDEGTSRKLVFDQIRNWLIDKLGFTDSEIKDRFGFSISDMDSFARTVNNNTSPHKSRKSRK